MLGYIISKLTIFALNSKLLTEEHKARVTGTLLNNLKVIPTKNIISFDQQGNLYVNKRKLDVEQAMSLRESVQALNGNIARKLIQEQVLFQAFQMGMHNGLTPDTILFSKAAIWWHEEENKLIQSIVKVDSDY